MEVSTKALIWATVWMLVLSVLFINIHASGGAININRPYYQEYVDCKYDLKQMTDKNTAICKCQEGVTGTVWGILGFLLMVGGGLFYIHAVGWNKKKVKKRKT